MPIRLVLFGSDSLATIELGILGILTATDGLQVTGFALLYDFAADRLPQGYVGGIVLGLILGLFFIGGFYFFALGFSQMFPKPFLFQFGLERLLFCLMVGGVMPAVTEDLREK